MYLLKITSNIQLRLDSKQSLSFTIYALFVRSTEYRAVHEVEEYIEGKDTTQIQHSTSNSNVCIYVGMVAVLQCLYFTNMTVDVESGHLSCWYDSKNTKEKIFSFFNWDSDRTF